MLKNLQLSEYVNNGVWTVVKSSSEWKSKVYPCCEEPYFSLTFNVTIQRNAPMIKAVVCSPALLIVILTLLSFWMPPQSSEKIIINGVSAVITSLMLLYFSQTIPVQATATPLIGNLLIAHCNVKTCFKHLCMVSSNLL